MRLRLLFLSVTSLWWSQTTCQTEPSCDSPIYCQGNLLNTVQMAAIFNDSKTFVDLKIVNPVNETLQKFDAFMNSTNQNPTKNQIQEFVSENFESVNEFEDWIPSDFKENPSFLEKINDTEVREFAKNLVGIWPTLARKIRPDILETPEQYSLIPVSNGFVIPGGRFKEFYYWDSYWIVKGLLLSEMTDTVRGMLDNFLSLVQRYGFIPNGSRVYYLNRSQPPMLTLMAAAYVEATNDTVWLNSNIDLLDQELRFWLNKKTIDVERNGVKYVLAHYDAESGSPRPESYREDVLNAQFYRSDKSKMQLYADLKSGAESGWDFSSRWIVDQNGGNDANISYVKTRRIIPVDLNAFLCKVFGQLSEFYVILGQVDKAVFWYEKATLWQKTIEQVLYDDEDGIWYDYDLVAQQPRKYFFPSNFAPLWTQSYDPVDAGRLGKKAAQYFNDKGIMDYLGGIPTSLEQTGEQWDLHNAWAPLQTIVILGLEKTGDCEARFIAKEFAHRWVKANMIGYNQTNEMFEKYDAVNPGQYGGGGEYVIQTGFGWTNGAALELISKYYTTSAKKV